MNKITVEPLMFFYMFAFMLTSVVEQAFFVDKACRVNKGYPDAVCLDLHKKENEEMKKAVQIVVSNFHQYNQIASHAVPIVLALFLGSWSDRRGRKLIILMGLAGKLFYSVMIVVNALQGNWALEVVLATASFPSAITGADLAIFAGVFSYLSDITTQKERTFRVAVLDIVYLSTMPTGVALGKYLYAGVAQKSFAIMFTINACLLVIAMLFAIWRLEWQTTPKQEPLLGSSVNCCSDFFDKEHVIQSVKSVIKKRPGNRRLYLIFLLIAMLLYTFQRDEKPMTYLYTQLKFEWTAEIYSDFKTFQSGAYVLGTLLGIPLMSKLLKLPDTVIVMVGAISHGASRFVYGFAEVSWLFYLGATIASLGPVVAPVLRSMTSKVVPISERGKVFAILAVADNAVPLVSSTIYSQVYNASINTLPSAIFWVTLGSQVIVFILALIIHVLIKRNPLEVTDADSQEAKRTLQGCDAEE
ncbi:probable peptidoglycan muropeptide transporter SLC46 isoform X2 [Anabrus simplex]